MEINEILRVFIAILITFSTCTFGFIVFMDNIDYNHRLELQQVHKYYKNKSCVINNTNNFTYNNTYEPVLNVHPTPVTVNSCGNNKLQMIMDNVANEHEYKANIYDCTEFSFELSERLRSQGWRSITRKVQVNCDSSLWDEQNCKEFDGWHEIVKLNEIYIEATTGTIIHPDDYCDYGLGRC